MYPRYAYDDGNAVLHSDGSPVAENWNPSRDYDLFTVRMYRNENGYEVHTDVATGFTRDKAANLVGILLTASIYHRADLVKEEDPGTWIREELH